MNSKKTPEELIRPILPKLPPGFVQWEYKGLGYLSEHPVHLVCVQEERVHTKGGPRKDNLYIAFERAMAGPTEYYFIASKEPPTPEGEEIPTYELWP